MHRLLQMKRTGHARDTERDELRVYGSAPVRDRSDATPLRRDHEAFFLYFDGSEYIEGIRSE